MLNQQQKKIYDTMSPNERAVVDAIQIANSFDEKGLIDSVIMDVNERRASLFDFIYIDLSIDRSTAPLEISGAGTLIASVEATDNNANVSIAYELQDQSSSRRLELKRGKRMYAPYSKFYIYHTAQAGKYMKLMRGFGTRSVFLGFEDDSGETANSDLVIALGNGSTYSTNQATVDTAADLIIAANTARKRVTIKNPSSSGATVYIGLTSGVTTSTGHILDAGDSITLNNTGAVYGIVAAGSVTLSYLEE